MAIDRTKRVKEARDEAKKEIDAYKKDKDAEFKKFETEVCAAFEFANIWQRVFQLYARVIRSEPSANAKYSTPAETRKQRRMRTRTRNSR
jgi:hypothetical protein